MLIKSIHHPYAASKQPTTIELINLLTVTLYDYYYMVINF